MNELIKYIDGDIQLGVEYDWKLIIKEFNKLPIPKNVYNPSKHHVIGDWDTKYFFDLSERSTGKSTQWLLLGMIMNKLYGTEIMYVRQIVDMIMPRNMDLFNTICQFGYIEHITDGAYNSVKYDHRRFYYYNTETGERAVNYFAMALSVDQNLEYKSSLNVPMGDLIIFDEFISRYSCSDEFIEFEDLLKTIIRGRVSPIVALLANTIDKHNVYFKEYEIYDAIQSMNINEHKVIESDSGTKLSVNLIGTRLADMPKARKLHNRLFFGFKNPRLNSIRGGEWAINNYPHLPHFEEKPQILLNNHYISHNGHLLRLELFYEPTTIGSGVLVHPMTREPEEDAIFYTLKRGVNKNERFAYGYSKLDNLIWGLFARQKWFYATNYEGTIVDSFISEYSKMS